MSRTGHEEAGRPRHLKVIKKLAPTQPGAIKLARRYGDALLCVRHRTDAGGTTRVTTVELIVETTPIQPRAQSIVGVRIHYDESHLQRRAREAGATWDRAAKLWRMPKNVALALDLGPRIQPEK